MLDGKSFANGYVGGILGDSLTMGIKNPVLNSGTSSAVGNLLTEELNNHDYPEERKTQMQILIDTYGEFGIGAFTGKMFGGVGDSLNGIAKGIWEIVFAPLLTFLIEYSSNTLYQYFTEKYELADNISTYVIKRIFLMKYINNLLFGEGAGQCMMT